ncbi:indole-3-glycerol phosphate synthase TrpC [Bacteroidota bacterium]
MSVLDEICANRAKQVAELKALNPISTLEKSIYFQRERFSLDAFLNRPDKSGIIAEFKRKSPSKGIINANATVKETTTAYVAAGASALSVLTEPSYFQGKDEDLIEARKANECPILRKDFTVDEYQIIEARAIGADAILLIAAMLTKEKIKQFHATAKSLGIEVLIEVHDKEELDLLPQGDFVLGVNNRNLKTMKVDIQTSIDLAGALGNNKTLISESGLHQPEDLIKLKSYGYKGFLIGEAFMKTGNPGKELARYVQALKLAV